MSTDPPSSDAEPSKPPILSDKSANKSNELDLWDLDAEDGEAAEEDETAGSQVLPTRRPIKSPVRSQELLKRTIIPSVVPEETTVELPEVSAATEIEVPVNVPLAKISRIDPVIRPRMGERSDLDDLEDSNAPPAVVPQPGSDEPGLEIEEVEAKADEGEKVQPDGGSPPPARGSTFIGSLSKIEKIGIASLIAILAIGAGLTLRHFSDRVPTQALIDPPLELPIQGELLTATDVSTFWREPILTGENRDTVRRGTQLIPVLEIALEGKPAAVRVFFRNEEGLVVGDGITRSVSGEGRLTIPATAGFDDVGMHAAYRTDETMPWIVQVFEAPRPNAASDEFRKLLETKVSTDIR